jgi:hypothetical protein
MPVSTIFFLLVASVPFAATATLKASNPIEFEDCGKKKPYFLKPIFLAYVL